MEKGKTEEMEASDPPIAEVLCTRTQLGLLRRLLTVLAPALLIPFLERLSSPLDGPGGKGGPERVVYKRLIAWEAVNRRS
jgi:hypothetical protein